VFKVIH